MGAEGRASFSLHLLLPFFLLFSYLNTKLYLAANSISKGQSLSANQTIVSENGNFELGFFTPGDSHNYYVGIWYNKIPTKNNIWVANRESPVSNISSAELRISEEGNLVILHNSRTTVWSASSTSEASIAVLLDTGNLVLRNGSNSSTNLWESFAHPTDTWMPGGWLGVNKITGEYQSLTAWRNSEDPAAGLFADRINPDGLNGFNFLWNGSKAYYSNGVWNGKFFTAVPELSGSTIINLTFVNSKERKFVAYTVTDSSVITRFVLHPDGRARQWYWFSNSQQWQTIYTRPLTQCAVYSLCGPFGVCNEQGPEICSCVHGFKPVSEKEWGLNDWSSGCSRKTRLSCGSYSSFGGEKDGFLELPNMRLPANPETLGSGNAKDCKLACFNNCSCVAYAYESGCSVWTGGLRNLQQLNDGDTGGGTLFLRLAASDIPSSGSSGKKPIVTIACVTAAVLVVLFAVGVLVCTRQRREAQMGKQAEGFLIRFTFDELQRMTKNFSEKLGNGGFGSVFRGTMPDSTTIAVKKLEGLLQGEKQFRTEVSTLGAIQHVNLVRLRGFCFEDDKRLLVYEYMPGGSLDTYLFRESSAVLDWKTRYQIILGIARGLAYLHEKCRECIIHCDIKPDNILLDSEFRAKVADFGMAKLVAREFSRVLTTMRGTVGYLAPEWISGLPITPKVDVYSFGMMLFELVSGKRNIMHWEDGSRSFYPSWAARRVMEGKVLSLLDQKLDGVADEEELTRVCRVAIWCIQDSEDRRPPMGQVVLILEGGLEVNPPPLPKVLENLMQYQGLDEQSLSNVEHPPVCVSMNQ